MRYLVSLLFWVALSIAGSAMASEIPKIDEDALREAMDDVLKDSESARFRRLEIFKDKDADTLYVICGEVNAKNSYGAYSGYTPFMGFRATQTNGKVSYMILGVSEASGMVCQQKKDGKL